MMERSLKMRLLCTLMPASVVFCAASMAGLRYAGAVEPDNEPTTTVASAEPTVVREAAVYLLSAYGTNLNDRGLFQSTLPGYTLSRRPSAPRDEAKTPTPLSLLTFSGPAIEDVDILLEFDKGRFLAHWPPARMRSKRLLWSGITLSETPPTEPARLADDHWLSPLRKADRLFAHSKDKSDRGLIYDAELKFAPHVTLQRTEDGYRIKNSASFPIYDVHVYHPADDGHWTLTSADVVGGVVKAKSKKDKDDEKSSDDQESAEEVFDQPESEKSKKPQGAAGLAKALNALIAAKKAKAEAEPAEHEAEDETSEETPPPNSVEAASRGIVTIEESMQDWTDRLIALGLGDVEANHITTILKAQAFRTEAAMLVYRLDEAQLEKLLPLEVTPYPDRLFRVAIVIVQDADPDTQARIDELVTRLGDDNWPQREAAQTQLKELGLAAKPKLEAALKSEDTEVVFRAEQLLESLQSMP